MSAFEDSTEARSVAKAGTARVPLTRDKDGVYHCEVNLRSQEKSNYPGH